MRSKGCIDVCTFSKYSLTLLSGHGPSSSPWLGRRIHEWNRECQPEKLAFPREDNIQGVRRSPGQDSSIVPETTDPDSKGGRWVDPQARKAMIAESLSRSPVPNTIVRPGSWVSRVPVPLPLVEHRKWKGKFTVATPSKDSAMYRTIRAVVGKGVDSSDGIRRQTESSCASPWLVDAPEMCRSPQGDV